IDALSKDLYSKLLQSLQSKEKIKALITNQKIIGGIGNVYADEILWEARISPFSISSATPEFKIKGLANAIKKVLLNAEKQIVTKKIPLFSTEAYDFLNIYGKEGEKSPSGALTY
ncbi:MAG: Fpg/Nei family DNA glycosylase, partial [Segetibacter sp.]